MANWGCKWGASDPGVLSEWEGHVEYEFYTAWSPPIEFLQTVAVQWPALVFVLVYEEPGMGFKGIAKFQGDDQGRPLHQPVVKISPATQININQSRMRSKRVRPFTFQTKANMTTQIESETEYPFTAEQLKALTEPQRQAIEAVAEYLTGNTLTANQTDEEISGTFNLLKPCKGCVPIEEVGEDLLNYHPPEIWRGVSGRHVIGGRGVETKELHPL